MCVFGGGEVCRCRCVCKCGEVWLGVCRCVGVGLCRCGFRCVCSVFVVFFVFV